MEDWYRYHARRYGYERWTDNFFPALLEPVRHVSILPERLAVSLDGLETVFGPFCFAPPDPAVAEAFPADVKKAMYHLDAASVVTALAVNPQDGDRVLDLCAAPGGKSLVLAYLLWNSSAKGRLVVNEVSQSRLARLRETIVSRVDQKLSRSSSLRITSADVRRPAGLNQLARHGPFDKILIDAPCTGDRVLLRDQKLTSWNIGMLKRNRERQLALVKGATSLTKPGGHIVYATCALSTKENEEVVKEVLERDETNLSLDVEALCEDLERVGVVTETDAGHERNDNTTVRAERSPFGLRIEPDKCGWGPIFMTRFRKC